MTQAVASRPSLTRRYEAEFPNAAKLFAQAKSVFTNGVTHDLRHLEPFPIYIERAQGARMWDRDGRAYTAARLLRERFGYTGQVRAVGDVLREQAHFMIRCGFDAFEPADGSTPADWAHVAARFRHVYQRAADDRAPAFVERQG